MKAFSALEALFSQQRNYEGLVKAYRRMLKRLPEETPAAEQVRLWHELGCICRDKLKDARGAIIAFEVAAKLDPTDVERQEHLGRLYVTAGPDAYDKAIQVNQRLLRHNPMRLEAYKELRRLYAEQGERDKTWCVCAALSLLNRASAEEKAIYDKHRSSKLRRVDVRISAELWAETIRHVDQTPLLNDLFAAVAPVMVPMAARPRSAFGLKAGERLNTEDDPRGYAHAYRYTSEVLELRPEEIYLRADSQKQLSVSLAGDAEHCDTLLWVHPGMLEEGRSEEELHFHFGRTLSLLRPEHVLYAATGSGGVLQAAVLACLKLVDPSAKVSGDLAEIDRLAAVLKTDLQPRHLDRLASAADELRQAASEAKIRTWMIGADLSLCRAGLVLCDDLETAARLVVDPTTVEEGALQPKLRLAQLFVYAVSEEYFKLRAQLKLQVS